MRKRVEGYAWILVKTEFDFDPKSGVSESKQAEQALSAVAEDHGICTPYFDFPEGVSVYDV